MKHRFLRGRFSALLLLLVICFAGQPALAAEAQKPLVQKGSGNRVTLDFRDIELTDLIQTISELTGKNFLYDETVKGKITVVSPEGMTLDEAYQLFQTVLGVKGFTIVPTGKVNKIVPIKGAKEANLPIVTEDQKASDQYITRLLRLENLDAATIAETVLTPLIPPTGNVVVYAPTNTLLITDSAANIERLVKIIQELDQPGTARVLELISLQHASAEEVAKICNDIFAQGTPAVARRGRTESASVGADFAPPKVIAYPRANALIVMANTEQLTAVKDVVAKMDQDTGGGYSSVNVYRLENADAETLAKTMNEILSGIRAETRVGQGKGPISSSPVTITADKPTNALIINAKAEDYVAIKGLIEKLDVKRKQVYVEALIMELSMDATQELGVSLAGGAAVDDDGLVFGSSNLNRGAVGLSDFADNDDTGTPSLLARAVDGLLAGGFFNPITVTGPSGKEITIPTLSVLINLSQTDGDVNILSAPRLLTSDNEEAEIIVGSNVPIITSRLTDTGSSDGLAQSVSIERKDVALILRFTPQVTEGDLVRLNVYQEMTDIVPISAGLAASVGNPQDVGPTFTKRVVRNTVLAENGKTVVLGGLIGTSINESETKVPWLGDIPFLGWLFKTKSTQEKKTNLLVFINPTVIRGPEDLARVTGRNRMVADRLMNERTRAALPEGYFAPGESRPTPPAGPAAPPAMEKSSPATEAAPAAAPKPAAEPMPTPPAQSAVQPTPDSKPAAIIEPSTLAVERPVKAPAPPQKISMNGASPKVIVLPTAPPLDAAATAPAPSRVLDEKWSTSRPLRQTPP